MNTKNTFTVLIPTWKRPEKLTLCLEHLERQLCAPDEIIVVIRPEDLDSQSILNQFKIRLTNLRIVFVFDIGVVAAENAGLREVHSSHVCFLDDDGYAPENWLKKIKDFFHDHPEALAYGGSDIIKLEPESFYNFPMKRVGLVSFFGKVTGNHHRKIIGPIRKVDVLKGVNMTFKRSSFDFLDENLVGKEGNLGNGSQWELDLCLRVKKVASEIYFDPELVVIHDSNHSNHNYFVAAKNNTHNLTYVILKNFNFIQKIAFFFYAIIIGNTQLPGILKYFYELRKVNQIGLTTKLFIQKCLGFFAGLRTYARVYFL